MSEQNEAMAKALYEAYCEGVGGVAFNGDPLPGWEAFRADPAKLKQSEAWLRAAAAGMYGRFPQDFVPGVWMCPVCNFRLCKRVIGGNTVSDDPAPHTDPCPNDGARMLPVSWQDYSAGVELFAAQKMQELKDLAAAVAGISLQKWTWGLPVMQQSVLLASVRGPDGLPKYGGCKMLLRWYRRCILLSALDRKILPTPYEDGGGSFTGRSYCEPRAAGYQIEAWEIHMMEIVSEYLRELDAIPHHFQLHFLHAIEIVGYKHPDRRIRDWWQAIYFRLVSDMHLSPETEAELDRRLGDSREGWLERADPATAE